MEIQWCMKSYGLTYETFVRLHREMEGAPFTGLKAAGTTAHITVMSDKALESEILRRC